MGALSKALAVLLAINMAIMFALPIGIFADETITGNEGEQQQSAPEQEESALEEEPATQEEPAGDPAPVPEEEPAVEEEPDKGTGMGIMEEPDEGAFNINLPLGGSTITSKLTDIHVLGEGVDEIFIGSAAGLDSAISWLNANGAGKNYVLYLGTSIEASSNARTTGFKNLAGKVGTLVITGKQETAADVPATPQPATSDPGYKRLTGGDTYFGCNIVLRNLYYDLDYIYMSGYDLTLGHKSWANGSTYYHGGSWSGTVNVPGDGTASITVYSTGGSDARFVGGMASQGTVNGNVAITIHNTSGNTINVYGGGYGTSTTTKTAVNGNVTTTIDGMATNKGGLDIFYGGGEYCDVTGKITNRISGPGRLDGSASATAAGVSDDDNIWGGSGVGTIGSAATKGTATVVIDTDVDLSQYTGGHKHFAGANRKSGVINGSIKNRVLAGSSSMAHFQGFDGGGGHDTSVGGSAITSNTTRNESNGTVTVNTAAIESLATFRIYGNITNELRGGCFTGSTGLDNITYIRGAGYGGYVQGDITTDVGTESVVYGGQQASLAEGAYKDPATMYKTATGSSQGYWHGGGAVPSNNAMFDIVGAGGSIADNNSQIVVGNTTLNMRWVIARWTYASGFGGVQVGDSTYNLNGGIVDTLEGSGYQMYAHKGNSTGNLYQGEVDWFFTGSGWGDDYIDGNGRLEVFDSPRKDMQGNILKDSNGKPLPGVVCNASMGGNYGIDSAHLDLMSGNSDIIVHGGDFSGKQREGNPNFSPGPTLRGHIFGDTSLTMDLRDNQYGFKMQTGSDIRITAGRPYDAGNNQRVGTPGGNSTMTLNILTDDTGSDLLQGADIYGTGGSNSTIDRTYARNLDININAPGSTLGVVYASEHTNIVNGELLLNTEINLVAAKSIKGLSAGSTNDNLTSAIVSKSAADGRKAVLNVGPQNDQGTDSILGEWHSTDPTDGYPHRINVGEKGAIRNFTEMDIQRRLLIAENGNVLQSGNSSATATAVTTHYTDFGDVTIHAGDGVNAAGFGVGSAGNRIIVGKVTVEGEGSAYVQSMSGTNQIIIADYEPSSDAQLVWLKAGTNPITTVAKTTWFGEEKGYPVITVYPTRDYADKFTPENFRGIELLTHKTFIGDSSIPGSGKFGYGVCIPGAFYTWDVVPGPDNDSAGMVSYNVGSGNLNIGNTRPSGGTYLDIYGTSMPDTPAQSGAVAIPSGKIPAPVAYPRFTFTPDATQGEWVYDLSVERSDHYLAAPADRKLYFHEDEQSLADYQNAANRVRTWQTAGDDKDFSYDITVDYTNDVELFGNSVILKESEAKALFAPEIDAVPGTRFENFKTLTDAKGRPFFKLDGSETAVPTDKLNLLGTPLGNASYRVVSFDLEAGDTPQNKETKTINIYIVPDDAVIEHGIALITHDADIRLTQAQAINGQAGADPAATQADPTKIDYFTGAVVIDVINDTVSNAPLTAADTHVANISGVTGAGLEEALPYYYEGTWDDDSDATTPEVPFTLSKTVVAEVIAGNKPFVLFDGNYDPTIPTAERDAANTYKTEPLKIPLSTTAGSTLTDAQILAGVSGWDKEDGALTSGALSGAQAITYALPVGTTAIPADTRGVYQVTYTVTDSDNNSTERSRALVVGDFTVDDGFILDARHFVINDELVSAEGAEAVTLSNAKAWAYDGAPATPKLNSKGSYTKAKGIYTDVIIGVDASVPDEDNPGQTRPTTCAQPITAQVVDFWEPGTNGVQDPGGWTSTNGDQYSLYGKSFRISKKNALTLQGVADANVWAYLLTATTPTIKDRLATPFETPEGATFELVSIVNGEGLNFFEATPEQLTNSSVFKVTLRVAAEPSTTITVNMLINTGSIPTISVPLVKTVNLGDSFPEGDYADATASYLQGVSISDVEDEASELALEHDSLVNTAKKGVYTVSYTVTDTEGNSATAKGVVVVNDGSYVVDPAEGYILHAQSFVVDVDAADAGTILADAKVVAQKVTQTSEGDLTITSVGAEVPSNGNPENYGAGTTEAGDYPLTIVVTDKPEAAQDITATVVNKDVLKGDETDPATGTRYGIGANHILTRPSEAGKYAASNPESATNLINTAKAEAWRLTNEKTSVEVEVLANGVPASPQLKTPYDVTFVVKGINTIFVTIQVTVDNEAPVMTGQEKPLVILQTEAKHLLTADELKAGITVYDAIDSAEPFNKDMRAETKVVVPNGSTLPQIDTHNVGVTQIEYSVTDSDGATTTALRAVVIDDGRYIIDVDDNIIIGAQNFVEKSSAAEAQKDIIRSLSKAEAYDITGNDITGTLHILNMPEGYGPNAPEKEEGYSFTWKAGSHEQTKTIIGYLVEADVVSEQEVGIHYAIAASNFKRNVEQAKALTSDVNIKEAANARVFKLINDVPDATVLLLDRGGFVDEENPQQIYNVKFGISAPGARASELPAPIIIKAEVSQGEAPKLTVTTPYQVAQNDLFDALDGVTAADEEDEANDRELVVKYNAASDTSGETVDPVNSAKVGLYPMRYWVTDYDNNSVERPRLVVVNDGSYVVGSSRVLYGASFVALLSEVNADSNEIPAEIVSRSRATVYHGETGVSEGPNGVSVPATGGYGKAEGVYPITLQANDGIGSTVSKNITGEVVDADVLGPQTPNPTGATTYVYGKNIPSMTISEAEAIVGAADANAALLSELKAHARIAQPTGELESTDVKVVSVAGPNGAEEFGSALGLYKVTVSDVADQTSITLTINVGTGAMPQIAATPKPLSITASDTEGELTREQIMQNVIATDEEAIADGNPTGDVTDKVTYTITDVTNDVPAVVSAIPAHVPGVYQVIYEIVDEDHNTSTDSRALVVNDGRYTVDPAGKYILSARSFVIGKSKVDTTDLSGQVLERSQAGAWKNDGTVAEAEVRQLANYRAEKGEYTPLIGIVNYTGFTKTIKAKVFADDDGTDGGGSGVNGERYSLIAQNFRINFTDANKLAELLSTDPDAYAAEFLERSGAKSYDRNTIGLSPLGNPALLSDGDFATNAPYLVNEGDKTVKVTFTVAEEPGTKVTISVLISNAHAPVLTVPAYRSVALNAALDEAFYRADVTAIDSEDQDITGEVDYDADAVKNDKRGIYPVVYTVTDSDYNTVTTTSLVVVGLVVDGDYAVDAYDFVKLASEVQGTDTEILTASHAQAWRLVSNDSTVEPPVAVNNVCTVISNGGYSSTVEEDAGFKDYAIQIGVEPETGYKGDPHAHITGKVIDQTVIDEGPGVDEGDTARYTVAADSPIPLYVNDARAYYTGTDDDVKARLIEAARAVAFKADPKIDTVTVDVKSNGIPAEPVAGKSYTVVFTPTGVSDVEAPVTFTIHNGKSPVITFTENPLVITQQQGDAAHNLTFDELTANMVVSDYEDDITETPITLTATPSSGSAINTHSIGVYKVNYVAEDSNHNKTSASRLVIINDGRYVVVDEDEEGEEGYGENDLVIGARSFVVKSETVTTGAEDQVRGWSHAEAYDVATGAKLDVHLTTPLPTGWKAKPAPATYDFVWYIQDHDDTIKAVKGIVVDADVVDPGTKDSQYALIAKHFTVNEQEAAEIIAKQDAGLIEEAKAQVIPLIEGLGAAEPLVLSDGGFVAKERTEPYPVIFSFGALRAPIDARVAQGDAPILTVSTPLEVWVGDAAAQPASAISADEYSDLYDVEITDAEDGDITPTTDNVTITGTVDSSTVGTYHLRYQFTDSDNNPVEAERVVVVNDGRYTIGEGRILLANGFVITKEAVQGALSTGAQAVREQIIGKSDATVIDGVTNANLGPADVSIVNPDAYVAEEGTYQITLSIPDLPSGTAERTISVQVVDADVIDDGPKPHDPKANTTYVFGNDITIRPSEAQELFDAEGAVDEAAVLEALGAGATLTVADGTVASLDVEITDSDPAFATEPGIYHVTVADENGVKSIKLTITIVEGNGPSIKAPLPVVVQRTDSAENLTRDELLKGTFLPESATAWAVSAWDEEDKDLTGSIKITNPATGEFPEIPHNVVGVYQVVYSVLDADGNPAEEKRAVLIDDGTVEYDDKYILLASSFLIALSEVTPDEAKAQILERSGASAAKTDGTSADATVLETSGYSKAVGESTPKIGVNGYDLTKYITAKVYDDSDKEGGQTGDNGDIYSILASNFRINLTDAAALADLLATDSDAYEQSFLNRAEATAYLRNTSALSEGGTPKLAVDENGDFVDGGFATATFKQPGDEGYPTRIPVTFWVDEEQGTSTTIEAIVSNGTYPTLKVPAVKSVELNAELDDAFYREGVKANDVEDGGDISAKVTYNSDDVNVAKRGLYEVEYFVEDSEGNPATKVGFVAVDLVVDGDYVLGAYDFVKIADKVNGGDNEILEASHAWAVRIRSTTDETLPVAIDPVVKTDGGYSSTIDKAKGFTDYYIEIGVDAEEGYTGDPIADITAKVIDRDVINEGEGTDEDDTARYTVAADNARIRLSEVESFTGLDDSTKARLINRASAIAFKADPRLDDYDVDVTANEISADEVAVDDKFKVSFIPKGIPGVSITVVFTVIAGADPVLAIDGPLEYTVSENAYELTEDDLLVGVTASDKEDDEANTPLVISVVGSPVIDTAVVGIYQVKYEVTDADDNTTSATRAVIVNDGRYELVDEDEDDNIDLIIGAKNYVVELKALAADDKGKFLQAKERSFVEVFDSEGNNLDAFIELADDLPQGYLDGTPAIYDLTWTVKDHPTAIKEITGEILAGGFVVTPPNKASLYDIVAQGFSVRIEIARNITEDAHFINRTEPRVIKLIDSALDKAVELRSKGGFKAEEGTYPLVFGAEGIETDALSISVDAEVTNSEAPKILPDKPVVIPAAPAGEGGTITRDDIIEAGDIVVIDDENSDLINSATLVDTATDAEPAIPADKPGVYQVVVSVEDGDGNPAEETFAVVVDDGRYVVDGVIIGAKNYVVEFAKLAADDEGKLLQAKDLSFVEAYDLDGNELSKDSIKIANGLPQGYLNGDPNIYELTWMVESFGAVKPITGEILPEKFVTTPVDELSAYVVVAKPFSVRVEEARGITTEQHFIDHAGARVVKLIDSAAARTVELRSDGGFAAAQGEYPLVFGANGLTELSLGVDATVTKGTEPKIESDAPIKIPVGGAGETLTRDDIIEGGHIVVTDEEAKGSSNPEGDITDSATLVDTATGAEPAIPADEPGVYQVVVSVEDVDGNTVDKTVAVVVDDGRYVIGEIILGAKNYVVELAALADDAQGKRDQAKELSFVEAYGLDGADLTASVKLSGGLPIDYLNEVPSVYPLTWAVEGYGTTHDITGEILPDGFVVTPPDKASAYAVIAKPFTVSAEEAAGITTAQQLTERAGARVVRLVDTAAAKTVELRSDGGFKAEKGDYPLVFGAQGIPTSELSLSVVATVTAEQPVIYNVTFDANGGTLVGPRVIPVTEPQTHLAYLPISPIWSGYTFLYWALDVEGAVQFTADTPVTSDITVYAIWQVVPVVPPVQNIIINNPPANVSPTYVTVEPGAQTEEETLGDASTPLANNERISDDTTPQAGITEALVGWSLFDVLATLVSLLLLVVFAVKFFLERRRNDQYEEEPIDLHLWEAMTAEQRAQYQERRELVRKAWLADQRRKAARPKALFVNAPALLVVAAALIEALLVLFFTQDFSLGMTFVDDYSVIFALVLFVQLLTPMVAAIIHNNNSDNNRQKRDPQANATL